MILYKIECFFIILECITQNHFMKALLIINPISGDIDKSQYLLKIKDFARDNEFTLDIFKTTGEDDHKKIKHQITESDYNRIVVMGGDGTIKLAIEATIENNIPLGIIPCGSANGLATSISLPKKIEENIPIAFGKNQKEIDLITINDEICIHLSDIGFNAEMIKNYEKSNSRGFWGYSVEFVKTLSSFEGPFGINVKVNGNTYQEQVVMLVIANASKYGTGFQINPDGEVDDGKFELVLVKDIGLSDLIEMMSNKQALSSEQVEVISTVDATILTEEPTHFQIDGEYKGEVNNLKISVHSKKVNLFTS